jgi:hypothetical protein
MLLNVLKDSARVNRVRANNHELLRKAIERKNFLLDEKQRRGHLFTATNLEASNKATKNIHDIMKLLLVIYANAGKLNEVMNIIPSDLFWSAEDKSIIEGTPLNESGFIFLKSKGVIALSSYSEYLLEELQKPDCPKRLIETAIRQPTKNSIIDIMLNQAATKTSDEAKKLLTYSISTDSNGKPNTPLSKVMHTSSHIKGFLQKLPGFGESVTSGSIARIERVMRQLADSVIASPAIPVLEVSPEKRNNKKPS